MQKTFWLIYIYAGCLPQTSYFRICLATIQNECEKNKFCPSKTFLKQMDVRSSIAFALWNRDLKFALVSGMCLFSIAVKMHLKLLSMLLFLTPIGQQELTSR